MSIKTYRDGAIHSYSQVQKHLSNIGEANERSTDIIFDIDAKDREDRRIREEDEHGDSKGTLQA